MPDMGLGRLLGPFHLCDGGAVQAKDRALASKYRHSTHVSVSPRITPVAVVQNKVNSDRHSSESSGSRLQGQIRTEY